ncbi:hypothetical protein R3P38DRAFT_3213069 [Favolaschia claudopus]|uniref:Uncharacterized protein n=1 Tax=Favolaschia claudopus TaxID=2862362 RepID=A0AAW0AEB6_9AGAR
MDSIYLSDKNGDLLVPIWSLNSGTTFCSFLAPFSSVSTQILKYAYAVPLLLEEETSLASLREINISKEAFWYNAREHWLGFIPKQPPPVGPFYEGWVDPIKLAFSEAHVPLIDQSASGYDSDGRSTPSRVYGHCVDYDWANSMCELNDALESIWRSAITNSDFYRKGQWPGTYGETPRTVNKSKIKDTYEHEDEAHEAVFRARLSLRSQVGFIAWVFSVITVKEARLSEDDEDLLAAMRLPERPKTGTVYNLARDRYEVNFTHLINNDVPFHYAWTAAERDDSLFLRYSPEYHMEVADVVRGHDTPRVSDFAVQSLRSFPTWKRKLQLTDWELRNLKGGKRGAVLSEFRPEWAYEVIYEFGFGARPIYHWNVIRAYSERFKAAVHEGEYGTLCTFFRYDPIRDDEPPFDRPPPVHRFPLTDFASECSVEYPEKSFYYEPTVRARERSKTLYAPRPGRTFNSFNGHLSTEVNLPQGPRVKGTPRALMHRIERKVQDSSSGSYGEVLDPSPLKERLGGFAPEGYSPPPSPTASRARSPVRSSDWAKKMAGGRTRSSRSLSPRRVDKGKRRMRSRSVETSRTLDTSAEEPPPSVEREFYSMESREPSPERMAVDLPSAADDVVATAGDSGLPAAPTVLQVASQYHYNTENEAVVALDQFTPMIVEREPRLKPYVNSQWNIPWLDSGVLVMDDSRTLVRLKFLAAINPFALSNIKSVLELAIRFAMPFEIYIPLAKANDFRDPSLSVLAKNSLAAVYRAGYHDEPMSWAGLGEEHQYNIYQANLLHLLERPNAVAFIAKGGICKFVAELYAPNLAYRFFQGPSAQVSEFARGKTRRIEKGDHPGLYTSDQVSEAEVSMLLGYVKGASMGGDKTLWPPQALFEKYSTHMRGYISSGAYSMLDNLRRKIVVEQCYEWRTRQEWVAYLRGGCRGRFAPFHAPRAEDFERGSRMLGFSFPMDWECENVSRIVLPETFDPDSILE